jgi:hypothetical protein
MSDNPRRARPNYEWDPERKLFIQQDITGDVDADSEDGSSLSGFSIDQLALLPDWLVPFSRRHELNRHKAQREREARTKLRVDWILRSENHKSTTESDKLHNGMRDVRYGPRGGRYTEEITRDGRLYRRYF